MDDQSPYSCSQNEAKSTNRLLNRFSTNVLIYSEDKEACESLEKALRQVLDCDRYTLYPVTSDTVKRGAWKGRAALVIIIGNVGKLAEILNNHFLEGGKLLALHSDLIETTLPYYKSNDRVSKMIEFTYEKWKSVSMKHQSLNLDEDLTKEMNGLNLSKISGHEFDIKILATEDISKTPSILKVSDKISKGTTVFSQICLDSESNDSLGENGNIRQEVLRYILADLGLQVKDPIANNEMEYTKGYFLGNLETKLALINQWCSKEKIQKLGDLTIQWYVKGESPEEPPSKTFLPTYINDKPENFSTDEYYDNLTSRHIGRLLIYSDVLATTMGITNEPLTHGICGVTKRQLQGRGRGGNAWISPPGQAIISLQIWLKITPELPLIQHATALAAVLAIRSKPYDNLDVKIKWPNDIYYSREVKIGGTMTTANCIGDDVIINIGTGVNISNSVPSICVNDIITEYNKANGANLSPISIEYFLAKYASELERILDLLSDDGLQIFLDEYYKYWLHDGEEIRVQTKDESDPVQGKISGVDDAGWLLVRTPLGDITVAPDGNTFDIMSGLIAPKF